MPKKPPSEALAALADRSAPIPAEVWGDLWDRLGKQELHPGEALAVLVSLTTKTPDGDTISALMRSLRERNPQPDPPPAPTVNIVGTGGGPSTFNLSTASAFVGAAAGARVIKTGSRAYKSRTGSVDLLDRLGIRMTDLLRADRGAARDRRHRLRRPVRIPEASSGCSRAPSCRST